MSCGCSNNVNYPCGCGSSSCTSCTSVSCEQVIYSGPNLVCSGIDNEDNLCVALQKLDDTICNIPLTTVTASNGLYKNGNDVRMGGALIEPTIIGTSVAYVLGITGLVSDPIPDFILTQTTIGVVRKTSAAALASTIIALITANNGITKTLNNFQLGGALVQPTTITATGTNTLSIPGLVNDPTATYVVTINNTTGLLTKSSIAAITPVNITADNGLTKTASNIQLGGPLIKNTLVDLATYKLSLLDSGAAPTGIEIIPGAAAPTNWTTANVNILSGKIYGSGLTWLTNNVGIGIQPIDSTINPATPRLNVVKTLSNGTTGGNNFTSSSNLILPSSVTTLSSTNKYAGSYSTLDYRPGANITVSGAQDKFVTASFHEFIFEPAGGLGNTTSNGKVSAIAARGYFVFASDIDSFSTIRIANSVRDSGNGYTGTIDELIGLKIDDQRADSTLSGQITKTYAIKQLGVEDENRYYGPTQHINNVGIGTTPEYNYNQGARLRVFSDDYILPTTGQSSLLCSSTTMNMQIASSGLYSVGRVVSNMNTLNLAFAGAAGSVPGTQNLASGGNWSSSFTYLRFTTPRTVSGTASSNSAQCNFVSNTTFYSNCSGSGTTILCANTTGLYPGAVVTVVSGTGVFLLNTIVLTVNPTSFVVDTAPGVALVSATVQAQIAGDMGTIITYRAMSPIADVALGYDGTITNSIGVLVEQQSLISGSIGTGSITNTYGIVQGSISDITKGQSDKNIFNSEKNVFPNMVNAATDALAAAAGVPLFGLYYIPAGVGLGGTVKIRLV